MNFPLELPKPQEHSVYSVTHNSIILFFGSQHVATFSYRYTYYYDNFFSGINAFKYKFTSPQP